MTCFDIAREHGMSDDDIVSLQNVSTIYHLLHFIWSTLFVLRQPHFRNYVIAVTCAVRGGQINLACGPYLISYLYRGFSMTMRDFRLVQGVIFKTYFHQFTVAEVADEINIGGDSEIKLKIV